MQMRGRHVLGIVVVVLGLLSVLATERYTARYQTLPVLDWLESRPPLFESSDVPPATELARGLRTRGADSCRFSTMRGPFSRFSGRLPRSSAASVACAMLPLSSWTCLAPRPGPVQFARSWR